MEGVTLLDFLRRREFCLVVAHKPTYTERYWNEQAKGPSFSYPYGGEHTWDVGRYERLLQDARAKEQFRTAYRQDNLAPHPDCCLSSIYLLLCVALTARPDVANRTDRYDDDNSLVAVLTQSVVQDIFWLYQAVEAIKNLWFPTYFVARADDKPRCFIIMQLTKEFRERFDAAWRRLTRDGQVVLLLCPGEIEDELPVEWFVFPNLTSNFNILTLQQDLRNLRTPQGPG